MHIKQFNNVAVNPLSRTPLISFDKNSTVKLFTISYWDSVRECDFEGCGPPIGSN